jgi:hypothetical protein
MATTQLITQAKLLNDQSLQSRTTMAILHISTDVMNEDPATPQHDQRLALANAAMRDPNTYMRSMYNYLIVQPLIVDEGADSTQIPDQAILDTVSAMWNTFAAQMVQPMPLMPMMMPPPPPLPLPA